MASEKEIENSILDHLSMHPDIFAWKNHTTGIFDPKKKTFRPLQGHSLRGQSDIIGIKKPGTIIAIEVKTPKTMAVWQKLNLRGFQPTSSQHKAFTHAREQKAFLDRIRALGGIYGVAASIEDAILILNNNSCKSCNRGREMLCEHNYCSSCECEHYCFID